MSYEEYQTPKKGFWPVMLLLAVFWVTLAFCAAAHAEEDHSTLPPSGPDYVTTFGIKVYDPYHHSFAEEVDIWAFMTLVKAPDEDRPSLLDIFDGMTVVIHQGVRITDEVYPCGVAPEGKSLLGCTDPFSKTINIAWRGCAAAPTTTAGIFSHEIGHLADFYVRGVLGHANPLWFGPDQDRMAKLVSEPLCRMGK